MRRNISLAAMGIAQLALSAVVVGQPASPAWQPTFEALSYVHGVVQTLASFDDGGGQALFAGGSFTHAGGQAIQGVARWDGTSWSSLAGGVTGTVQALTPFDGALFIGGNTPGVGVRRWDGTSLSSLPWLGGNVLALIVFDDGGGPDLYAGGTPTFSHDSVVRWDGLSWSPLGQGFNGTVHAMAVYDDGRGPALYVGGAFSSISGAPAQNVARWHPSDGWSAVGSGFYQEGTRVRSLAVLDDGSGAGPQLVAGGEFTSIGGQAANNVARWNGTSWSGLASGLDDVVRGLAVVDGGLGPQLYAAGDFTAMGAAVGPELHRVARWTGTSWTPVGQAFDRFVNTLAVHDDGTGPALHAGGQLNLTNEGLRHIARLDGDEWGHLGHGLVGPGAPHSLAAFDAGDGLGPRMFAAGDIDWAGNADVSDLVAWDGSSWVDVPGVTEPIDALGVHDDGSGGGPALYAAGETGTVRRWDGSTWSLLGAGLVKVFDLATFDEGLGPVLFAGGSGAPSAVARWDGNAWSGTGAFDGVVRALAVVDDGGGPRLIAGGTFHTVDGVGAERVAAWDGSNWAPLGGGMDGTVLSLAVFDDGSGPALFAGGSFSTADGVAADRVARWNGLSWTPVGGGFNGPVRALVTHDDGSGPALYAGGTFSSAGGSPAANMARWDGLSWSPLAVGTNDTVEALLSFDDGSTVGPGLFVAGDFDNVGSGLALWARPEVWRDLGGGTAGVAGVPDLSLSGPLTPGSVLALDLVDGAPSALAVIFIAFTSWPAPFLGGTLHAFPVGELVVVGTDGAGEIHGAVIFPGAPAGTHLWFQVGIADPGVPIFGASLSDGTVGIVP